MAVPGDKVYNNCLPFAEPHQKLLGTILIVLGIFALLEYTVKLISLIWITSTPFLKRICDSCFQKGGKLLKTMKILSSSKKLWKESVLLRNRKKQSNLRFRCVVDPVKVTVRMSNPPESKICCAQVGRKSKAFYSGEWSSHHDTDDKKTSWYRNQSQHQNSPCSSHLSDTETPQPACPAGSVASWVRFSFSSPERVAESSSAHYGIHARNHQRATGDKQLSSEIAREGLQGQRFPPHGVGLNTEEPAPCHSDHPHERFNHLPSVTNFIPSPILPGPRRVVYSALASDTMSRTHLNSEEYAYPHSPRGPQHRLGLEWHQHLPVAQQAEVYVYLISPPTPSPEHNTEQPNHPFSTPRTTSGKETLAHQLSLSQSRGSSSQNHAIQGTSDPHKQRKSIWERKHQRRSLQPNLEYEKLAAGHGSTNVDHQEPFSHNPSLLADRGRAGLDVASPIIAS
ncbi:uncharacterized protein [Anolis sagrei]|uniref:uncharacterized protein isoform X1 n=1 Tax=Anolis sagrei TaxID=38937 RepID=UPI003522CBCA